MEEKKKLKRNRPQTISATSMIHFKGFKIKCTPLEIKSYFPSVLGGAREERVRAARGQEPCIESPFSVFG